MLGFFECWELPVRVESRKKYTGCGWDSPPVYVLEKSDFINLALNLRKNFRVKIFQPPLLAVSHRLTIDFDETSVIVVEIQSHKSGEIGMHKRCMRIS